LEYFTDPSEALINIDQLVAEKIDIIFIIVDYLMPKMTGAELIREIKAKHPNLKCVMLSGHANPISIEALNKENMLESFISKPWNEEELFDTIRPILEGYTR
jgi:DNA-binding NarL/FixJ family response regulator